MSDQNLEIRHVARALVFDPADRLLLIEYESVHALGPDGKPARFWFMPGGGLEPGEDHVTACRRELSEEIGVADCAIGPQVAACDGPFHLFRKSRDARERYFLVRLPDDRIDTSRLMETEDNPLHGTRWWTVAEMLATDARIEPAGLGQLAARLVAGHVSGRADHPALATNLSVEQAASAGRCVTEFSSCQENPCFPPR